MREGLLLDPTSCGGGGYPPHLHTHPFNSPSLSLSIPFFLSRCHLSTLELRCPSGKPSISFLPLWPPSSLHHAFLMDTLVQRTNDFYFWQGRAGSSYIGLGIEGGCKQQSVHGEGYTHVSPREVSHDGFKSRFGKMYENDLTLNNAYVYRQHTRVQHLAQSGWLIHPLDHDGLKSRMMKEESSPPRPSLNQD